MLAALLLGAVGCAGDRSVEFRVVVVGDDPFLGADTTEVRVHAADGTLVALDLLADRNAPLELGPLPFGAPLVVEVETRLGSLPLALGRSFPFVVPGPEAAASGPADVTLGLLGRHAPLGLRPGAVGSLRVLPSARGAWLVSADAIIPFLAHGADGHPALGTAQPLSPPRRGAAAIGLGGGVLLVGGAAAGASFIDPSGAERVLEAPGLVAVRGIAPATVDGAVLLAGGEAEDGTLVADVWRVRLESDAVLVEPLPPLPAPRAGAQATAFLANGSAGTVPRVLVEGGRDAAGETFELVVIDPTGTSPSAPWTSPRPRRGCAIAPLAAGQVMLAGGVEPDGTVVSDVDVLVVDVERPWVLLAPAPDPLFRARTGAVAVPLAPGLILVAGGTDPGGAPIDATELADLRLLPGRVRLTGSLPEGAATTDAAALEDGTILVAAGSGLSLYFPFPP